MQPAIATLCRLDGGAPVRFTGDIQVHVGRLAAGGTDLCLNLCAGFIQDISEDHMRTLAAKHACFAGALSPGSTTDEGHFAIEPTHNTLLLECRPLHYGPGTISYVRDFP